MLACTTCKIGLSICLFVNGAGKWFAGRMECNCHLAWCCCNTPIHSMYRLQCRILELNYFLFEPNHNLYIHETTTEKYIERGCWCIVFVPVSGPCMGCWVYLLGAEAHVHMWNERRSPACSRTTLDSGYLGKMPEPINISINIWMPESIHIWSVCTWCTHSLCKLQFRTIISHTWCGLTAWKCNMISCMGEYIYTYDSCYLYGRFVCCIVVQVRCSFQLDSWQQTIRRHHVQEPACVWPATWSW